MKQIIILLIFIFNFISLFSNENTWYSFHNKENTLMGFKDSNGNIKIEPRYVNIIRSGKFNSITIVEEKIDEEYISYYLTTSGKKVFKSIYTYDNSRDSESEGFIRFRDNDNVGMLDRNGEVVIPPIYNDLQKVRNGLVVALKGARKEYWESHNHTGCNHFTWVDGTIYLIDTSNRVLVEDYTYKSSFNLFSIEVTPEPSKDPDRVSFTGVNGNCYSFIDHKKEFENFVKNKLIIDLSLENIIDLSYDSMSYMDEDLVEKYISSRDLLTKNYTVVKKILSTLRDKNSNYSIFHREMSLIHRDDKRYQLLKDDIESMEKTLYTNFVLTINNLDGKTKQDQFYFMKIDGQYKLIDISLGSSDLNISFE